MSVEEPTADAVPLLETLDEPRCEVPTTVQNVTCGLRAQWYHRLECEHSHYFCHGHYLREQELTRLPAVLCPDHEPKRAVKREWKYLP